MLKIHRTEVQNVKILQMFSQVFQTFNLAKFCAAASHKSQEFSKHFIFWNKPNNDKLFALLQISVDIYFS